MLDKELSNLFDFEVEMTDEVKKRPTNTNRAYLKLLKAFLDSGRPTLKLSCPTPLRATTVSGTIRRVAEKNGFHITCWKKLNEVWVIRV